jgi:hypothetical protein
VGKADLRRSNALRELESVVFCDRRVITRPSSTDSDCRPGSWRIRRNSANSLGKPWRERRESRTERHWSGVGASNCGYGSLDPLGAIAWVLVLLLGFRGILIWRKKAAETEREAF